jgi:hypothetical protein
LSTHLSAANAGRSPLVPLYVSGMFAEGSGAFRVQLIETLMRPMGALGLLAVAGGAFAALRQRHGWHSLRVTLDDAARISADQVLQLASYLQQAAPGVFRHVAELVADRPLAAGGLSAVLLMQLLRDRPTAAITPGRSDPGSSPWSRPRRSP